MDELQIVKTEIRGVKRSIGQMLNVQGEMFTMLKNLKRAMEGKHFDLGKCCHTVSSICWYMLRNTDNPPTPLNKKKNRRGIGNYGR